MAYLGLARKWRPQIFSDLVGQEHIATTITNAILKNRISQGYLFTGTRGIGKTSAARIFAKALRCTKPPSPGVPCNVCADCVEVSEGRSVDVLEIDGASNNGVDAVREIRENVKFLPSSGKYKIYIIDEVHMLTTAAFNALLKTLEEPPPHVVFIFATTDPQKIPETVLSRCQRFDFKRVALKDLQARLLQICAEEKIKIDTAAIATLAREAEGSMRDAVSLLDQVLSLSEGKKEITVSSVISALGLIDKQTVLDCVTGILNREPLLAIEALGKVYMHGFDLKQFGREVLRFLRTTMIAKLLKENNSSASAYLDLSDIDLSDVEALIDARSLEELEILFRILSQGLEDVARSAVPKMVMDVLLIKMASFADLTSIDDVSDIANDHTPPATSGGGGSFQKTAALAQAVQSPKPIVTTAPVAPAMAPVAAALKEAPAIDTVMDLSWWKLMVEKVKMHKPFYGTLLEHLIFDTARIDGAVAVIRLLATKEASFYREQFEQPPQRDAVSRIIGEEAKRTVKFEFGEAKSVQTKTEPKSLVVMEENERKKLSDGKRRKVLDSEAFQATEKLLGAKLEMLELKGD